jgi:hypothetical protein
MRQEWAIREAAKCNCSASDPAIANAEATYVSAEASINADATIDGDGGQVVVWSDGATEFHGTASARGGAIGGDGGLIEVSGKGSLTFTGSTDRRAPAGNSGMLLRWISLV